MINSAPFSYFDKGLPRQQGFVNSHALSGGTGGGHYLAYIMPTAREIMARGEYNVSVPDLNNAFLKRIKVEMGPGQVSANGTGKVAPVLRPGQAVTLTKLANKHQFVITGSYGFSGPVDFEFGIDKKTKRGGYNPYGRSRLSDTFSVASGEIVPYIGRSKSQVQEANDSPAQVELPGTSHFVMDDGSQYQIGIGLDMSLNPERISWTEGKRESLVYKPYSAAINQGKRLPYEINRQLNRVYEMANGQFLPREFRESPLGVAIWEQLNPILSIVDRFNDFLIGADQFVEDQIKWFKQSIIEPAKQIFAMWKDVFSEGNILDALGLTPLEIDINVLGFVNSLVPNTGFWLADAAIQRGLQELSGLVAQQLSNLGNLNFGLGDFNIVSIGFGGGSGNQNIYLPTKGSIASIAFPTIASEGSPLFQTIKAGKTIFSNLDGKVRELGGFTSSLDSFIDGIALEGAAAAARNRKFYRDYRAQQEWSKFDFRYENGSIAKTARQQPHEVFLNSDSYSWGTPPVTPLLWQPSDPDEFLHPAYVPGAGSFVQLDGESDIRRFTTGIEVNRPSIVERERFVVTADGVADAPVVFEVSDDDFQSYTEYPAKQVSSSAQSDKWRAEINYPKEDSYIYKVRARVGKLRFNEQVVRRPGNKVEPVKGKITEQEWAVEVQRIPNRYAIKSQVNVITGEGIKNITADVEQDRFNLVAEILEDVNANVVTGEEKRNLTVVINGKTYNIVEDSEAFTFLVNVKPTNFELTHGGPEMQVRGLLRGNNSGLQITPWESVRLGDSVIFDVDRPEFRKDNLVEAVAQVRYGESGDIVTSAAEEVKRSGPGRFEKSFPIVEEKQKVNLKDVSYSFDSNLGYTFFDYELGRGGAAKQIAVYLEVDKDEQGVWVPFIFDSQKVRLDDLGRATGTFIFKDNLPPDNYRYRIRTNKEEGVEYLNLIVEPEVSSSPEQELVKLW